MKYIELPNGERVPALGQGTWHMGDDSADHAEELEALRVGLDLGATLIDSAEMYGDGRSEQLVGEAIQGRRNEVFLVTKVLPQNASKTKMVRACEASLARLKTEVIDLYLLHWKGAVPIGETIEGFLHLQQAGKIRHYGVSNFDLGEMKELWTVPGGRGVVTNQLLYNLSRRNIEWDLLPWLRQRNVTVMAYSPLEQARLSTDGKLAGFAQKHGITPSQAALAWLLSRDGIICIPKTSRPKRVRENMAALKIRLSPAQLAELEALFPPPKGPRPLEIL
jgi:aldehyde reductase